MDKEENVTRISIKSGDEALDGGIKDKPRPNSQGTTNGKRPKRRKPLTPSERIALIGAAATVIVALLGFQPLINWLNSRIPPAPPISIPTSSPSPVPLIASTQTSFSPETSIPTILSSMTNTPVIAVLRTDTATVQPASTPKLIVLLEVNQTSGRKPLTVRLDARGSYLTDLTGQKYICRNGACYYTWKVYSNGQQLGKSVTDSGGTFDFTFGKQGTYMITVWICRGKDGVDCGGNGAQIIVTK